MDMLVKLYGLPTGDAKARNPLRESIEIRRAMVYERSHLGAWVAKVFNSGWADECRAGFSRHPVGCYIAVASAVLCGFCCIDCTYRGFLGPIGVHPDFRDQGVGRSLLLSGLEGLRNLGYAYAVIGDVGEPEFFEKSAGAVPIAHSTPGPYPGRLKVLQSEN
jgi:ribosomal protein S18 acetylase RimI-like enzyme